MSGERVQNKRVIIVGATSAIAEAAARLWAADGSHLYLIARDAQKLAGVAADLRTRGAEVQTALFDANHVERHEGLVADAFRSLGKVDAVLIAHGDLPNQRDCEIDVGRALAAVQTNAVSVLSLLCVTAKYMEAQRGGVIATIGSVAGDRGRKSNYVYGASKALVATFMDGLAGRLQSSGIRVINIKPGFVDTPMTAQFKKGPLWAAPGSVAKIIYDRMASAGSGSYYAPRFWWFIMAIIRALPARIVYRLNI